MQADLIEIEGELYFFISQWIIFALRMTFPVFGHQDAAHIAMTFKADAEHIPDLTLIPVGVRVDAFQGVA